MMVNIYMKKLEKAILIYWMAELHTGIIEFWLASSWCTLYNAEEPELLAAK